jgi:hypothetical protein
MTDAGAPVNRVCLQTADDVYPPREKEFLMWEWMGKQAKLAALHSREVPRYVTFTYLSGACQR